MPRGDRTGPMGLGPMTGRRAGYCAGYGMPGYMNPMLGQGFGMGFGRGRGRGFFGRGWQHWSYWPWFPGAMHYGGWETPYQQADPESEKQMLKEQAKFLQSEMETIKKRLSEIEASAQKAE